MEGLRAPQSEAHGIGLVPVQGVGVTAEPRGQALQAGLAVIDVDLIRHGRNGLIAQTFKTEGPSCPIWGA